MRGLGAGVFGRACTVTGLATLAVTTSLMVTPLSPVRAQPAALDLAQAGVQAFDIPPQPLADALIQFGRQAGLQISAETSLVQNLRTNGVAGTMGRDQALAMLLAGTGLTYRINGSMVALERLQTGTTSGAVQLEPLRIEGQRPPETAYGPIQGFVAHQS